MNLTRATARELTEAVIGGGPFEPVEVVLCPPFVYLQDVASAAKGAVGVGAQNVYFESKGAYTGEVSLEMLEDCGATHVIIGHSERRQLLGETDADVNRKLQAILKTRLQPIVCVGETLDEREAGSTSTVVRRQAEGAFSGIEASDVSCVILAYEPVWAIGTGKTATPEQAQEVHLDLRNWLGKRYNSQLAESVRILYGGSVKGSNAGELMAQDDIDGALVGGASLKADEFLQIIAASRTMAHSASR
jgi:triosephosphate isomerase